MIFINILMFFQSDSTLFSVTHQGVLHVNQQIPTLKFYKYLESRITFGKCRVSYTICIVLPNHQEGTTNGQFDHLSTKIDEKIVTIKKVIQKFDQNYLQKRG